MCFGMPKSTVSTILKNEGRLQLFSSSKFEPGRKCQSVHCDLEETLFCLLRQARSMNVPLSGPILKLKPKNWLIN